jgi:hypothetical protein
MVAAIRAELPLPREELAGTAFTPHLRAFADRGRLRAEARPDMKAGPGRNDRSRGHSARPVITTRVTADSWTKAQERLHPASRFF